MKEQNLDIYKDYTELNYQSEDPNGDSKSKLLDNLYQINESFKNEQINSSYSSKSNDVSKLYNKLEDCNYVSNAVSNNEQEEESYQDYLNNADLDPLEEGQLQ